MYFDFILVRKYIIFLCHRENFSLPFAPEIPNRTAISFFNRRFLPLYGCPAIPCVQEHLPSEEALWMRLLLAFPWPLNVLVSFQLRLPFSVCLRRPSALRSTDIPVL